MIPAESRMREIRTSGSTSGGVGTDRMGAGLSTKRKRGQMKHRTLPGTAPPPDSTRADPQRTRTPPPERVSGPSPPTAARGAGQPLRRPRPPPVAPPTSSGYGDIP